MTKQPPAVPLPGPNVTPEPNEKIKCLAGNFSRHTKQATRHPANQENTLARRDSLLPSLCLGQTSLLNRMKKTRVWQAIVPGTQTKPQDALQIRKTPWHGVTKQPPALKRMKKSRVWQAIVPGTQTKPQDTLQIRKTPWHGVTKQPPALNRMKNQGSGRQLFQAHKTSHKTPFKSGKHPSTA